MKKYLVVGVCFLFFCDVKAQEKLGYVDKVATLDATIETLYSVISGDAGVKRDWDLFRYLFTEDAKLIPIQVNKQGEIKSRYLSPEKYIELSGAYIEENGFIEKEIYRVTESFGALTQVFTTYEAFKSSKDTEAFLRGINSVQLFNDGTRWWIINISWYAETEQEPLPAKYLPK